jgi:hypothetical protein
MQPKKDDTFKEFILDQVSALGNVRAHSIVHQDKVNAQFS